MVALEGASILVPAVWALEIANAILVGERSKRLRQPEIRTFSALLQNLSLVQDGQSIAENLTNVLPLAREFNLSAYDAAYLELALRHNAPLATFDRRLRTAATKSGARLFPSPTSPAPNP